MKFMRTREESLQYLEEKFKIEEFASPVDTYFKPWQHELALELKEQEENVKNIVKILLERDRIYTVALGRSRLVSLNTGMRFLHIGYFAYEVGHPYSPAMGTDERYKDALYSISGGGETEYVVTTSKIAKRNNVPVIGITSNADSRLAKLATEKIVTKGKKIYSKDSQVPFEFEEPINFLQTKSEYKAFCIGELLVNSVAKMKGITEKDMERLHSNTETLKES